ncbi:MAG: hypothetical protein JWO63_2358 [Frankiales bacterium]|jgi:GAF domain-containing protein|nr:hypothetical protein [Frankiales bacterium]
MTQAGPLSVDFLALARALCACRTVAETLKAILTMATERVDGAQDAAVTLWSGGDRYETVASTGSLPAQVLGLQYKTLEGPCIDAIKQHEVCRSDDVAADERWPVFARLATDRTELVSTVSQRLYLEDDVSTGALSVYSRNPAAFGADSLAALDVVAAHSAIALAKAENADRVEHLQIALHTNRSIGMSIGILMATYKATPDEAFELLRLASQQSHRKLSEIAVQVVHTGTLDCD